MGVIRSYRDLEVWQLGMRVARHVYMLTRKLPREEQFGLSSQMRRAAVSIPSNIAEGHARTTKQYQHHLTVSLGSLAELETQLLLTADLYSTTQEPTKELLKELDVLGRKLRSLTQKLDHAQPRSARPHSP